MPKPSEDRISFLIAALTVFSIILWCYLFRFFLNGSAPLQGDAYPYLEQIRFYVENMMRGIYPLWNPLRDHGNINEFFLRRIGEYNPFFWLIALLNKSGLSFVVAHRLFFSGYYFLGIAGFYLLSQRLFHDRRVSFTAALVLFFSSLGAKAFESFLLLEIVPYIWFFYFLTAFLQTPRKEFFLGAVFVLMIINITYIPFYFYTILLVFFFSFAVVYAPQIGVLYRRARDFWRHNRIFTAICAGLLVISLVPGFLWHQQARRGEALSIVRHVGSPAANSATLAITQVNEGGVSVNETLDRQFVNLDQLELKDFYVPLFAFLMLFAGMWGRLNRRLIALFGFGFSIFLIGLADASCVHKFLYAQVPFFKYFRNVQFFLWLAVLPVFILFCAQQMRGFIQDCEQSRINRGGMTLWVTTVHVGAAGWFWHCGITGFAAYAVTVFSLGWMLGQIWAIGNPRVWVLMVWAAVVLQPFEAYSRFGVIYPPSPQPDWTYQFRYDLNGCGFSVEEFTGGYSIKGLVKALRDRGIGISEGSGVDVINDKILTDKELYKKYPDVALTQKEREQIIYINSSNYKYLIKAFNRSLIDRGDPRKSPKSHLDIPSMEQVEEIVNMGKGPKAKMLDSHRPYFTIRWMYEAMECVNYGILMNYLYMPFIAYDRVERAADKIDCDRLQRSMDYFDNVAFVHSPQVPGGKEEAHAMARIMTNTDKDFAVLKFDANDVIVRTGYTQPKFLVRTSNYHSQWQVFVDGKPAQLFRTNILAQGVWVPAGEHVVHWHFGPLWRYVLAYFFVILYLGVLGWMGWLLLCNKR